jgi:NTP pyrophosphatase (non-canonical NTP hydrolase)
VLIYRRNHPEKGNILIDTLLSIASGYARRFPAGDEPFQMMTRLLEECGELAQQVNHFERTGVKVNKYCEPDRTKLAKEVHDCLICVLQVARHYGIEKEVEQSLQSAYQRLLSEGHIPPGAPFFPLAQVNQDPGN